jgi:AcrR family transcriptional regulator
MTMKLSRLGRPVDADRRAARRLQILAGARSVFARKGFQAASTAEIGAAAGVSAANIYQYFPTKDDLVMGLIDAHLASDLAAIAQLGQAGSLAQGVAALAAQLLAPPGDAQAVSHSHALRLEILAAACRHERVAKAIGRAEADMINAMAAVLTQAQGRGEVPAALDARLAAASLLATVDGFMARVAFTPLSAQAQGQALVNLLTALLQLRPSRSPRRSR